MALWRIWYSRSKDCNWLIQEVDGDKVWKVNHVDIQVSSQTEESARRGSCPPPFTILAEGELKVEDMVAVISCGKEDSCI